jgi:multidrug efflux pump subunit AcrA (membrane-fusion protein)
MQQMTPEQRRMMELEQQLKQYQEQEQMAKQQAEEERMAQLEAQQAQVLQSKIIDGLKAANAPTTPEAVKRMAAIYLKNLELGLELEVSDLADEYKAEVQGYLNNTFKGADIDQLIAMFGTDVINKIRKYDLQKMNEKNKLKQTKVESRVPNPPKKGKDYETTEEWLERMRSKKFDD